MCRINIDSVEECCVGSVWWLNAMFLDAGSAALVSTSGMHPSVLEGLSSALCTYFEHV